MVAQDSKAGAVPEVAVAAALVADAAAALAPARPGALRRALLESRQRWQDLAGLAADFAFETDAEGRFTFIFPDPALGWPSAALLGQPAGQILARSGSVAGFDPFRPRTNLRHRTTWLRRPDGSSACLVFASAPMLDVDGRIVGARGVGLETTVQEGHDAGVAAALRRQEVVDHILWRMGQEVMAPRMMQAALDALATATGAEGVAVVRTPGENACAGVLHRAGGSMGAVLPCAAAVLDAAGTEPVQAAADDRRLLLVCPSQTRFGERTGLILWREPGARPWDPDDRLLASSATGIIRMVLEHAAIQHEMARQARTDPLTGLLNRRAFIDEMARRIDRLDREEVPGTLMFVDLDHFKALNDRRGHDSGDEALCIVAGLLRDTVRPADLVARLGGDEFALWLDGADELVASERAESLRQTAPLAMAHLTAGLDVNLTMSVGIATRWPHRQEDIETLIARADQAMYQVKRSGRGHWRVGRPEDP
jgi:diguanylate cyclase (GGDEF)-like protein